VAVSQCYLTLLVSNPTRCFLPQNAAPACTELEMKMMDWLAQMLGLPEDFCFGSGKGGGVIQATASESTLIAMLCARCETMRLAGFDHKIVDDETSEVKYGLLSRLVAYTSSQAHSSVEKAALLSATRIRIVPTEQELSMDVSALRTMLETDRNKGLIPFIVIATLGTTNTCAFDDLRAIGDICMIAIKWWATP